MQRFKPKRRVKKMALFKAIILVIIIIFIFKFITNLFFNHKELITNSMFLDMKYSYDRRDKNIFRKVYDYAKENVINTPSNMLVSKIVYKNDIPSGSKNIDSSKIENVVVNKIDDEEINNQNINDDVLIYIYNSHQKEEYCAYYMEDYNVIPNVFLASHIMQEKLDNSGIKTMVMEDDITAYLNNNKLDYSKSYQASRYYLAPMIDKYSSVKLFIDLHRDSTPKDISTTVIDNKSYAKVMFVIGREYDTYESNLKVANDINNRIILKYPTLSRGVLQKEGYGVNGVYNQDLKDNIILIELGGDKNNLEEITNTIDILVEILGEYVNEKR